jgi:small nuclear ribonucleoprotein (snRNP)-like protein
MYLIASFIVALAITIFLVSKIAEMLQAKRSGMSWIFLASTIGAFVAALTLVPLGLFVEGLDPNVMLILTVVIMLIVSSMAFKYINKMNWGSAITTNIANIVLSLVAITAAVVLNGGSLDETYETVSNSITKNTNMVSQVASGDFNSRSDDSVTANGEMQVLAEDAETQEESDIEEPLVTELDLLPLGTVEEIAKKKTQVYIEPKYHVISISNIRSVVGKPIRILKKNGNKITGSLERISGNDIVVLQRLSNGSATTPISLASIKKLEVYK